MNHIFTPGRGVYETGFANEAAARCFHNPNTIISLKVHGECAVLLKTKKQDGFEWIFATRYDTRGKKDPPTGAIAVPNDSPQPSKYQDHHYWLIPLDKDLMTGRGKRKTAVGPDTYAAIAAGIASGDLPDANHPDAPAYMSVEWIGRKHQGNVDCIDADHALTIHGSTVLNHLLPVPRSREQVEALARVESIEGLVLYDPDTDERFKIRLDMFPDSRFVRNCKGPITNETTSIKPKVIMVKTSTADIASQSDNE